MAWVVVSSVVFGVGGAFMKSAEGFHARVAERRGPGGRYVFGEHLAGSQAVGVALILAGVLAVRVG